MTLETFFEKFDQFADALDAVAKMRELVLQLAVQGKLVDQKRSDGEAAQLLADISGERDTRAAKLRTPDEPATADGNERAFPIPSNWAWTQLGNIALQIQYGYTASADASATEIRMLRITDIQNNRVDWPSVPGCQIELDEAEKYLLSPNDILIARTGGTIGKSFIVPDAPVKSVFASYLIRVTPPRSIEARYLKTFLESPLYWSQLRQMSAGTGQPNVNGQALGRLEIPLPPLAEQKRIVAKVDELMALCDRLESQQQERETRHAALARASLARFADAPTPANLPFLFHPSYAIPPADLRKSILTLAVQGKLVPQDPNDELALASLDEIEAEKAALIAARKLRPNRITEISQTKALQYEAPDSWRWFRLGDVAFFQEGPGIRNWQFRTEGIKLLNVQNIVDGKLVLENTDRHISTEEFESTYRHFAVETGDILFASSGASWGKTAWFVDPGYTVMLNTSMVRLKFYSKRCDDAFLLLFLRTEFFKTQMEIQLVGIQPNFGSTHLGRVYIPLPPLAEQRRIVAKVEQLMALVDALETQLAASRATAANLLSALVAELTIQKGGVNET